MRALLLVLLLTGWAVAESREVTVRSFPPHVSVYRVADAPGGLALVGTSGHPVLFERDWFLDSQGRLGNLSLVVRAPGYRDQTLVVSWEQLASGLESRLTPTSWWVGLRDRVRVHPQLLWLGLFPLAAATGLRWLAVEARRRGQAAASELNALQSLQAGLQADAGDSYLGKQFSPFVLTRRLGVGGMGCVYRASGPDGEVALKVIRPELSDQGEFRDRFWREIRLAGKLNHRGIVNVYPCDQQDGLLYCAMELISGRDLNELIPAGGLEASAALALFLPALEALEQAHKADIVHRDLKPSNILVEESGRVVLMDFGLAKSPDSPPLTATGAALGTPAYMAPEQIMGRLDTRSDQYAMGIVLYELLCGRRPFLENDLSVIWKHVSEEVPAPRSFRADLPAELESVVLRMLAKDPEQRFPDLQDLRIALERISRREGSCALSTQPPAQRRSGGML